MCSELTDSAQYYVATCRVLDPVAGLNRLDGKKTAAACKTFAKGTSCEDGCLLVGRKTAQDDTKDAWRQACEDAGATGSDSSFEISSSEEDAKEYANCKRSG